MSKIQCWGISREPGHSPNRIGDDYAIFDEVAQLINQDNDFEVIIFSPDNIPAVSTAKLPHMVFCMCEEKHILDILDVWQTQGVTIINTPQGIINTYRYNTYSILRDFDFFPKSALIPTDKAVEHIELSYPLWVKRADFHAMQTDDVCICRHSQELSDILTSLRKRAVKQTFIQEHIEGDLIKFYGIGDKWFKWFYHKDQTLKGYHFDINKLESITKQSAKGLGLEIYGGDIVINQDSKICLIDMNAWPSFALYRKEASQHIACHIIRTHKNQRPIMV